MKKPYVEGSGNIYADMGAHDAEERFAKASLVHQIVDIIHERKLTQVEAAKVLGVDQPKVSALMRGRLADFSMERIFRFMRALGQTVEISVKPSSRRKPTLAVSATRERFTAVGRR
jgi:predicted XRE-type DNA-binding protein